MLWMFLVCALSLLVCLPFYMYYKRTLRLNLAVAFKLIGTLCAAALALTAAVRLDQKYWICFIALVIHAAADVLLEYHLYIGAGFFVAGHICYICFFVKLFPVAGVHLIISLCLLGIVAFLFWRWRKDIGKQMPLFIVYGFFLSLMCACAVSGLTGHSTQGILIAAGGALFFFSDALLLGRLLFSASRPVDWTIMITYYSAQLLFGLSCLI